MNGHIARKGFLFQDLYLLLRVLHAASNELNSAWQAGSNDVIGALGDSSLRFGIEAAPSVLADNATQTGGLDWDVLVLGVSQLEFAEVKSGAISKEDRVAFWRRLRRELAKGAGTGLPVNPILVVDPSKCGPTDKWQLLAQAATVCSGTVPREEPTGNVLSCDHLLAEAMWYLCHPDDSSDSNNPAVDVDLAKQTLSRFELHCHEARQLDTQVLQLIELIFPGGLTDTQQQLLIGWLSKRATNEDETRRLFSIRELLVEIGIFQDALSLMPGTLKEWRTLWNEAHLGVQARTRICLGKEGATISADQIQPGALEALEIHKAVLIFGSGGAGKSTFAAQATERARLRNDEVLYCGADDISPEELEQLTKAIRFVAALTGLRRPEAHLFVCVDGLDECDASRRKLWAQVLVKINGIPNVQILAAIRDTAWRSDGNVRKEFEPWSVVSLDLWPDLLVRELLKPTAYRDVLPASVVDLLRTPILLDLFWRTFVESKGADVDQASRIRTRHDLLAAFWLERLLNSPRHVEISNIGGHIADIVARASETVGGFVEAGLDEASVQALLSEGVLVREGCLQPRLRFRHPLLRDFAFAQWCLSTNNAADLSEKWGAIQGGFQRQGALRAICEALSDPDAQIEYQALTLQAVIQTIVTEDPSLGTHVAQILGSWEASPAIDPATWPASIQSSLPPEFARDLLSFARLNGNGTWAARLEGWPDEGAWFNRDYAKAVHEYASVLSSRALADSSDLKFREHSRQAARKLRCISESPQFTNEFSENDRWLKMAAIRCVVPILPDTATFGWVEREMTQSSWRTRSFLLSELIHLASVDAPRTAEIYRQAVGLTQENGRPEIIPQVWIGSMDHQAIEWSLGGQDGRSLLNEHPLAFLPVAVDLAEALWSLQRQSPTSRENDIKTLVRHFDPSFSEESYQKRESERKIRLAGLIDDQPGWRYAYGLPTADPYERCLEVLRGCVKYLAEQWPSNWVSSIDVLHSSRMASIHLIVFEVMLEHRKDPGAQQCLQKYVLDSRLYYISGFEYWLEQALIEVWPSLKDDDRGRIFNVLRELLSNDETEDDAERYLVRLPVGDLPEDLRDRRPADDERFGLRRRPQRASVNLEAHRDPPHSDEIEIEVGEWPSDFNKEMLKRFAREARILAKEHLSNEEKEKVVASAIDGAKHLLPIVLTQRDLLEDATRFWLLRDLTQILSRFRSLGKTPDPEVVVNCAQLSVAILENLPGEMPGYLPDGDVWSGHRETSWGHALHLADEALTWPPATDDVELQAHWERIIRNAFATENPILQLLCTISVRPWHWHRSDERRKMRDELVWSHQRHPSILAWSVSHLHDYTDSDREKIVRLLLERSDIPDAPHLAYNLGLFVGRESMWLFRNGHRTRSSEIARESINSHSSFPLLQPIDNRREYFRGLIFGMKEQAKYVAGIAPQLATDYGDWSLKIWRIMRAQRRKTNESEGIVLLSMHWLEKRERQTERNQLKAWLDQLLPLFHAVISEGGRPDCNTLLFNLRSGEYNDLSSPQQILGLIEAFIQRIRTGAIDGSMDLDERIPSDEDYHSWRECAEYAAELIESLFNDSSLKIDSHRENAHCMLTTLAAEPICSSRAVTARHRLQNY